MTPIKSKIDQLLAQGENAAVEFKNAAVGSDAIAKEIVAFANTQGGTILIGIDDDKSISGITKSKVNEEWISNIARNNVIPSIDLKTTVTSYCGKNLLIVDIPKGKDKPYQTIKHQYLIRVGSTNRIATQQELLRLYQQSGAFHYDVIPIDGSSIVDLNLTKLDQYFNRYDIDFIHDDDREQLLKNTDILTPDGQVTIGGMLVFGINPQRYLPNASISFAHFHGKEVSDILIDKQVIGGTLDYQIDTTLAIIKNNLLHPSTISGTKTASSRFIYEDKVFRELLVNACIHRNYAITGSRIRIFLFEDRLEFRSPGKLPNTVTIEKLTSGVSYAVNPVILKFMENLRYIDKLGRGIPMVWQAAKKNGKIVEFEEIGEEFLVRLSL